MEPDGTLVGTVNEDWAIESNGGDIFQLGNTSWRILRVEPGVVRVADAKGQPPTIPFWLGEAPGRTRELAAAIASLREESGNSGDPAAHLAEACGDALPSGGAVQIADYVAAGRRALGCVPTQRRVVLERFFDESGGTQLVVHAPFGSRINRAWGLALRKKFCVGFGFELQAAANEEAIVLSLGPQHSFELSEVFDYLHPASAREVLVQAVLAAPVFETRWRWNAQRSLLVERYRGGRRVPPPILRMRANDALAAAFPQVLACPETLPGGADPRSHGSPDRGPNCRGLSDRGHGRRGVPGGPSGFAGRFDRAGRDRHGRALGVRTRNPELAALHLPRRRPARGAPDARRLLPTRARRSGGRGAGIAGSRRHRARARGGVAAARRRGGGARGAALDGLRHRGGGASWGLASVARRARGRGPCPPRGRPRGRPPRGCPLARRREQRRSQDAAARTHGGAGPRRERAIRC